MSEYLKRSEGGFYIIDDPETDRAYQVRMARPVGRVLAVRRAVNQIINPKTGTPFPERDPIENYWTKYFEDDRRLRNEARWREQYEGSFTNQVTDAELTRDALERTIDALRDP